MRTGGVEYTDVATAIGSTYPALTVRERYSRHFSARIRAAMAAYIPQIAAGQTEGFVRLVQRQLAEHRERGSRGPLRA